jgi:hypothetical protein
MASSDGDPRVLFVMNLVLSSVLSFVAVSAFAFLGSLTFAWSTVAAGTVALMIVTYLLVLR